MGDPFSKDKKKKVSLRTSRDMVESVWVNMEHFLPYWDPDTRKETKRLQHPSIYAL